MSSIRRYEPAVMPAVDLLTAPKIISIMSGKGGAGKSVVSHNLALAAGQSGLKTLLVDFDWCLGSLHVLANAAVQSGLEDVIENGAFVNDCAVQVGINTSLLASASAVADVTGFDWPTDEQVREFIQHCRETLFTYDLIIIDTPSGIQSQLRTIASESDAVLLVVNPELTSISDGYGLLKWLIRTESHLNTFLLLNRVSGASEATDIAERFSSLSMRFLNQKPQTISFIQEDGQLRQAVARQRAVVDLSPESVIANQFRTLVGRLKKRMFTTETPVQNSSNVQMSLKPTLANTDITK